MNKHNVIEFSARMTQLSDALRADPPTEAAIEVWLDTLKECIFSDVLFVLTDWAKSHAKMPLPIDVLKAARDLASARLERETAARNLRVEVQMPWERRYDSGSAQDHLTKIREMLARAKPAPTDWIAKILQRADWGDASLSYATQKRAEDAAADFLARGRDVRAEFRMRTQKLLDA